MEWISVKDKLPKENGKYLVHTTCITGWKPLEDNIFIADFCYDWIFKGWESNSVTHWMPLPKPPKEIKNG